MRLLPAAAAASLTLALFAALSSAPHLCAAHLHKLTRSQYLQYRQSADLPTTSPTPSATASATTASSLTVVFIPSFQGTLLRHAQSELPLFLAPLSRDHFQWIYQLLLSDRTTVVDDEHAVEYAAISCDAYGAHFSHCLSLPSTGPLARLRSKYRVRALGYDWRQTSQTILDGAFAQRLAHALQCDQCVLVAHGSACPLLRLALDERPDVRAASACIAPVSPRVANLTAAGDGLMPVGDAHKFSDCMKSVRERPIDYGSMAVELGMLPNRRGRSALPHVEGPDYSEEPMVPKDQRRRLAAAFDAVAQLGRGGRGVVDVCVEGSGVVVDVDGEMVDGDGVVERGACAGLARRVVSVEAGHLDIVRMVDAVVHQLKTG